MNLVSRCVRVSVVGRLGFLDWMVKGVPYKIKTRHPMVFPLDVCFTLLYLKKIRQALPKKKTKEELDKHFDSIEQMPLEKGDFPAMVIAALITFLPVLIIAMVIIYGLIWLIFMR